MERIDHCKNLIHFTKGNTYALNYEEAYKNLLDIVYSNTLKGGTGMILGKHNCVCFTESPARCLTNKGELDNHYFSRYAPFGVQYTKPVIFQHGGRPVIYSTKQEYEVEKSNENLNWRFVTYNLLPNEGVDFSWEREWRIKRDSIPVNPSEAKLLFQSKKWIDRFIDEHERLMHRVDLKGDCPTCYCTRDATILNYSDFLNTESCELISGSCPDPQKFPWILINLNANEE